MRMPVLFFIAALVGLCAPASSYAQQVGVDRLAPDLFDVVPPSALVRGEPGRMRLQAPECRTLPSDETRRRIVDVAVQEWAFFGFRIADQTVTSPGTNNAFPMMREATIAGLAAGMVATGALPREEAARSAARHDGSRACCGLDRRLLGSHARGHLDR